MMDNILKLAALQDSGDIPPAAEDSIALLFAERYALELRHVAAWGWWLSYDGTRWTRDDTLHAFDRARAICREIAADCERSAHTVASAKTVAAVSGPLLFRVTVPLFAAGALAVSTLAVPTRSEAPSPLARCREEIGVFSRVCRVQPGPCRRPAGTTGIRFARRRSRAKCPWHR